MRTSQKMYELLYANADAIRQIVDLSYEASDHDVNIEALVTKSEQTKSYLVSKMIFRDRSIDLAELHVNREKASSVEYYVFNSFLELQRFLSNETCALTSDEA